MKSLVRLFMLGILAVGVASCSLFDVEIDTTFEGDLFVEVDEPMVKSTTADSYPFQASATIDVLDDEDVYEYQDKIDDFIVSGVTVAVTSVTPSEGVELLPQTAFTITNGTRTATWTLATSMPVEVGTSQDLEDLGKIYETVNAILGDMKPFTISAVGSTNVAPVSAVLRLGIKTKVVANPLN
jgi:hypothetical protein